MTMFSVTESEARALVKDKNACARCRQEAASALLTRYRTKTGQDEILHNQALILHNAGREAHTCGK